MTRLRTTFWFRQKLVGEAIVEGLHSASSALKLDVNFLVKGKSRPNSLNVWKEIFNSFKDYQYTGEAKWIMDGELGQLKGKIYWPILNPGNLPGTVEFDFSWDEEKKPKKKNIKSYVFDDLDLLMDFLHKFAASVSADSVRVEPLRLPPDLIDSRYERFIKSNGSKTMSSVDWIFGIKSSDQQKNDFIEISDLIHKKVETGGFILYALTPNPLNYKSEEDVKFLELIERKIGLL